MVQVRHADLQLGIASVMSGCKQRVCVDIQSADLQGWGCMQCTSTIFLLSIV